MEGMLFVIDVREGRVVANEGVVGTDCGGGMAGTNAGGELFVADVREGLAVANVGVVGRDCEGGMADTTMGGGLTVTDVREGLANVAVIGTDVGRGLFATTDT
jgi:hypothetical protein